MLVMETLEVLLTTYCPQYLANLVGIMRMTDTGKSSQFFRTQSRVLSVLSFANIVTHTYSKISKEKDL